MKNLPLIFIALLLASSQISCTSENSDSTKNTDASNFKTVDQALENDMPLNQPDFTSIADKLVNYSLKVKPGETIILTGNPEEIDLLKELLVAVRKAGGHATVELNLPEANRKAIDETPMEYLSFNPKYEILKTKNVDGFITISSIQDPDLWNDVSEEKISAIRKSYQPVSEASNKARFRNVTLGQIGGIPTEAYAKSKNADYHHMINMFWAAVDTDYESLQSTGKTITQIIRAGSDIQLTSEAGTNLSFKAGSKEARINDGVTSTTTATSGPSSAWLPAGEAYVALDPLSANGTIVIPEYNFRGKNIKDLKITFKNGKMTSINAENNLDDLKKFMELSTGQKDVLSIVDIGINPNSQPMEGSNYYSWEMGGMVTLVMGNNQWAGGDVQADISLAFHIANSNLSIDNIPVVEQGKLQNLLISRK